MPPSTSCGRATAARSSTSAACRRAATRRPCASASPTSRTRGWRGIEGRLCHKVSISGSRAERNSPGHSKLVCNSPGHSRDHGNIHGCFQSRSQESPPPPLPRPPRRDRHHSAGEAGPVERVVAEWAVAERDSPSNPDCRLSCNLPVADKRDSNQQVTRCRWPTSPPSTLGNAFSCRH